MNILIACMHEITRQVFLQYQERFINEASEFMELLHKNIYKALVSVQGKPNLKGKKENVITDDIRDQLNMIYEVRDQSRIGLSLNNNGEGEVDLSIWKCGMPITIIEAVRLSSVDKMVINIHLSKLIDNYNPYGCKIVFLLIYYTGKDFPSFWKRLLKYISDREYKGFKARISESIRKGDKYLYSDTEQVVLIKGNEKMELTIMGARV